MPVIAILNPKGGCGKTTLATNLARALHDRGLKTLLVDSDPQGSAADWHAVREDNPLPFLAYGKPENFKARQEVTAGKPKAAFVISRAIKRTVLSREVLTALAEYPFLVFEASTMQRQSYPRKAAEGKSVFEDGSKEAAGEITAITNELLRLVNGA